MERLELCTEPFRAEMAVEGGRVRLSLGDERFTTYVDPCHLKAVLEGETVQISGNGCHCRLDRREDQVVAACTCSGKSHRAKLAVWELESLIQACRATK